MYSRGKTPEPEPEDETPGLFGWFGSFFQPQDNYVPNQEDNYVPPEIPIQSSRRNFKDYKEPYAEPLPTREPYKEERRTPKYFRHSFSRASDPFSRYQPPEPQSFSRHPYSRDEPSHRDPPSETREEFVYNDTETIRSTLEEIDTSIEIIQQLGDATHAELLDQLISLKESIRKNPEYIKKWDKTIWYRMVGEACSKGDKPSCFKIFGLTQNTPCAQIKKKYFKMVRNDHPDRRGNSEMAQILNDAYEKICKG